MAQDDKINSDSAAGVLAARRQTLSAASAPVGAPFPFLRGAHERARAASFNRRTGAGSVRLAETPDRAVQRAIVKSKRVVHAVAGARGAVPRGLMRHALYVARGGAGREGGVFDKALDQADLGAFVARCTPDHHHFRIIVSPELGVAFAALRDYARDLMRQSEADLRAPLDWIAGAHHDTGRAHIHFLVRGAHMDGRDLALPYKFVSCGLRDRAEELATQYLGPRFSHGLGHVLGARAEAATRAERPIPLDKTLHAYARDCEIELADLPGDNDARAQVVRRLNRLEDWGLAMRSSAGAWRIDIDLEDKLGRVAQARARERALALILAQDDSTPASPCTRPLESAHSSQRVTGRLVGFAPLAADRSGPHLIGVDAIDGQFWTARVARLEDLRVLDGVAHGAIVALARAQPEPKPSDRTIWEIASARAARTARSDTEDAPARIACQDARTLAPAGVRPADLFYSPSLHRHARPDDRDAFIEMHARRLEALARNSVVERGDDGTFILPADYLSRVAAHEGRDGRESARVTLLDPHSIEHQAQYRGPAWLDRVTESVEAASQLAEERFGGAVRRAAKERAATLRVLGLHAPHSWDSVAEEAWRERLRALERADMRTRIERDTGRIARFAHEGEAVAGLYARRVHGAEQSFALILHDRTATLAPWRAGMDRALGQFVSGRVSAKAFEFFVRRARDAPMHTPRAGGPDL